MEFIVRAMRGWAVPLVMPIPRPWQILDEAGRVLDPPIDQHLRQLGREVVRAAIQLAKEGRCDYSGP